MQDIELRDGETYTTLITFPEARVLTHECVQGPLCFRSAAYCATEGEVAQCEHWSCLDVLYAECELCFIETMEDASREKPHWWDDTIEQDRAIRQMWIKAGGLMDGGYIS